MLHLRVFSSILGMLYAFERPLLINLLNDLLTCNKIVGDVIAIIEMDSKIFSAASMHLIVTNISSVIKVGLVIDI